MKRIVQKFIRHPEFGMMAGSVLVIIAYVAWLVLAEGIVVR